MSGRTARSLEIPQPPDTGLDLILIALAALLGLSVLRGLSGLLSLLMVLVLADLLALSDLISLIGFAIQRVLSVLLGGAFAPV